MTQANENDLPWRHFVASLAMGIGIVVLAAITQTFGWVVIPLFIGLIGAVCVLGAIGLYFKPYTDRLAASGAWAISVVTGGIGVILIIIAFAMAFFIK